MAKTALAGEAAVMERTEAPLRGRNLPILKFMCTGMKGYSFIIKSLKKSLVSLFHTNSVHG